MIDMETQERLEVNTEGTGPYLMVPLDQLSDVRGVLERHGIRFVVAEDAVSVDGRPFIAIIDFGLSSDAARIQEVLDAA